MNDFVSQSLQVCCRNEDLLLHPKRVMYWPAGKTLFAADIHAGKEHVFARSGIAIPSGISEHILQDLFALCDASGADRLVVLGDFVHSTPLSSEAWLSTLSSLLDDRPVLSVRVIAGNHDTARAQETIDPRIGWQKDSEQLGPFVLRHAPGDDTRGYLLSGHLHPTWRLSSGGRHSVRAPVFWFRQHHAVLPAFGSFTGGMSITPDEHHDRLYMVGNDCVMQVPVRTARRYRKR
ncbi:ligase-associated DNA damage response endonuclease PdeM [Granulosicoccus sp. 3-233]|uniref:ligase-associated DNA damage response endonuclease PdeM n=1 Tax=Granulosicoccus sp. 3-233 TaxID=3417969 RepID=UPI003D342ECD